YIFFFSSRRRHTRFSRDWSSDVCSSDLELARQRICLSSLVRDVLHRSTTRARSKDREDRSREAGCRLLEGSSSWRFSCAPMIALPIGRRLCGQGRYAMFSLFASKYAGSVCRKFSI